MHTDLYIAILQAIIIIVAIYEPACNHIKLVSCAVNIIMRNAMQFA